jgi:hypothetical protein
VAHEVELPDPEELREKAESRFGRRVARVTAIFAVILAIAALGGNHAMKEMLLAQQQASDPCRRGQVLKYDNGGVEPEMCEFKT